MSVLLTRPTDLAKEMAKADRQRKARAGIKRKLKWPKRDFNTGPDT